MRVASSQNQRVRCWTKIRQFLWQILRLTWKVCSRCPLHTSTWLYFSNIHNYDLVVDSIILGIPVLNMTITFSSIMGEFGPLKWKYVRFPPPKNFRRYLWMRTRLIQVQNRNFEKKKTVDVLKILTQWRCQIFFGSSICLQNQKFCVSLAKPKKKLFFSCFK